MVGRPDVAQKRTCAIADRRDLDRKSGRSKADGPILIWRRLLLSSTGASGVASRDGGALDRVGARPCRGMAGGGHLGKCAALGAGGRAVATRSPPHYTTDSRPVGEEGVRQCRTSVVDDSSTKKTPT